MILGELFAGIPHKLLRGSAAPFISSIEIDSRKVKPGALYVAIRGLSVDGHGFIGEAVKNGAAAVLADTPAAVPAGLPVAVALVDDSRAAMSLVAANYFGNPAKKLQLVGVTGTNGKTTTTVFIEELLRESGFRTGLIGTFGAKVDGEPLDCSFATSTTPDPLELHGALDVMQKRGVTHVVMEVTSHALHFRKTEGLRFCLGVFTNLSQDHLDIHGTMESYALAKAGLFAQSDAGIANADDEAGRLMLSHLGQRPRATYGISSDADFRARDISFGERTEFALAKTGQVFSLAPKGLFNVYNALAAIAAASFLGVASERVAAAVAKLAGVAGRIQEVPNSRGLGVFVDYAHTPDGLVNIISAVRQFTKGRVITLVGCGGDRDRTKRPVMGRIAAEMSDFAILTSDNPRTEDPHGILSQMEAGIAEGAYGKIENRRDAIFEGVKMLEKGDSLIIAGKGHEDYQIIGAGTVRFSDYDTALEAIQKCG